MTSDVELLDIARQWAASDQTTSMETLVERMMKMAEEVGEVLQAFSHRRTRSLDDAIDECGDVVLAAVATMEALGVQDPLDIILDRARRKGVDC